MGKMGVETACVSTYGTKTTIVVYNLRRNGSVSQKKFFSARVVCPLIFLRSSLIMVEG